MGRIDGVAREKDEARLGDDWLLLSGLIWVAISLLETARDTLFAESSIASYLASTY